MRKIFTLMMLASAIFFTNASAWANVEVIAVDAYTTSHYGYYTEHREVVVKVNNLGYEKNIVMHAEMEDGSWMDLGTATYSGPANDGWEIWKLNVSRSLYNEETYFGDEFVIKYEVNGETYWDNNDGQNYTIGKSDGEMIVADVNVLVDYASAYNVLDDYVVLSGSVLVKNLGYDKSVKVRYTTDGWATYQEIECEYQSYYWHSWGDYITYPNVNNVERWNFYTNELSTSVSTIEYAVVYTVNGEEYWDNNYENNYVIEIAQ